MLVTDLSIGYLFLLTLIHLSQPTCVLESDFGFKINCAFKKAGLFRVRNLGGIKAHASLGFSLGDELGFEQSLTNLDPSRRRSVSVKNGAPPNAIIGTSSRPTSKQEKRGKQNRIMMRPQMPPSSQPNPSAMQALSNLHRRASTTMQPIVVDMETPRTISKPVPKVTMAKPVPMGLPPFKPLPPKEDTLKVLPIAATTKKTYTPLQLPQSKGPGLAYQSENQYPRISHDQVSKMVSQMTASHINRPSFVQFTSTPFIVENFTPRITMSSQIPYFHTYPTTVRVNPFVPMPVAAPPTQAAISIIPAPVLKDSVQIPLAPSMISKYPTAYSLAQNTISIHKAPAPAPEPPNPFSNFVDPVPHHVNDLANQLYPVYSTKKVDDYNSITGYGDDVALNLNKDDINEKIAEIAKIGNISMEAIEAAIALRQQQLLTKFSNIAVPPSPKTTTTTTTEAPLMFQPEPEMTYAPVTQKQKRYPTTGKVMNAPKEYYPVGYEKNFDDQFQSKVDLPDTTFHCGDQKYFPGLYGDENLGCMVFHVCALTDDGLVMKSFLCPESTLFDQTILKCNWWFYVDCKNTRKLYDTNIPVSKSYQLMKALTFFSSYKKDGGNETKPEEMDGIKEAISILENHDTNAPNNNNNPNSVQIVTPQTPIYNKDSNVFRINVDSSESHRSNRNYKNVTRTTPKSNRVYNNKSKTNNEDMETSNSNINLINVKANSTESTPSIQSTPPGTKYTPPSTKYTPPSTESSSREVTSKERRYRRRQIKQSEKRITTIKPMITSHNISTTTETSTTIKMNLPIIEAETINRLKNEIVSTSEKSLTTEIPLTTETVNKLFSKDENVEKIDASILKESELSPPIKRFYRSSAETNSKEMTFVKHEKVQIVRSKPYSRFVGESPTPTAAIARLDDAILGKIRRKKDTQITIITPQKSKDSKEILSST